eukprot:6505668-Pyramimonas_sp.AAC.1
MSPRASTTLITACLTEICHALSNSKVCSSWSRADLPAGERPLEQRARGLGRSRRFAERATPTFWR